MSAFKLHKLNRQSDFAFRETLLDGSGNPVDPLSLNWEIEYRTTGWPRFSASHKDGVLVNAAIDENSGELLVLFNGHNLPSGELIKELHVEIDSALFPDGIEDNFIPRRTGYELWDGATDCGIAEPSEFLMNYYKGEQGERGPAFTYEDFTPAEIAELQKPATDAAKEAASAAKQATDAAEKADDATARAEAAAAVVLPTVENIDSAEVVIAKAEGHHIYVCTAAAVSSLTITEVENSPRETVVRFTSGQTPTTLNLPESLKLFAVMVPQAGVSYEINIANGLAVFAKFKGNE